MFDTEFQYRIVLQIAVFNISQTFMENRHTQKYTTPHTPPSSPPHAYTFFKKGVLNVQGISRCFKRKRSSMFVESETLKNVCNLHMYIDGTRSFSGVYPIIMYIHCPLFSWAGKRSHPASSVPALVRPRDEQLNRETCARRLAVL